MYTQGRATDTVPVPLTATFQPGITYLPQSATPKTDSWDALIPAVKGKNWVKIQRPDSYIDAPYLDIQKINISSVVVQKTSDDATKCVTLEAPASSPIKREWTITGQAPIDFEGSITNWPQAGAANVNKVTVKPGCAIRLSSVSPGTEHFLSFKESWATYLTPGTYQLRDWLNRQKDIGGLGKVGTLSDFGGAVSFKGLTVMGLVRIAIQTDNTDPEAGSCLGTNMKSLLPSFLDLSSSSSASASRTQSNDLSQSHGQHPAQTPQQQRAVVGDVTHATVSDSADIAGYASSWLQHRVRSSSGGRHGLESNSAATAPAAATSTRYRALCLTALSEDRVDLEACGRGRLVRF